jgi:aminopeptidase N
MMEWLSRLTNTPFPFEKYYQIILPDCGGAMENISLVTWDESFYMFGDSLHHEEREVMMDRVNIHEMGHSYFGDAVVMRHFEHAWLKESWVSQSESISSDCFQIIFNCFPSHFKCC